MVENKLAPYQASNIMEATEAMAMPFWGFALNWCPQISLNVMVFLNHVLALVAFE